MRITYLFSRRIVLLLLLLVIAIVGYIALRPHPQVTPKSYFAPVTAEERNQVREKSLASLGEAIQHYRKSHDSYPFVVPKTETAICNGSSIHCKQVKLVDVNQVLVDGMIQSIPSDPSGGKGQYNSGFSINRYPDGSILLFAPRTENITILSYKL